METTTEEINLETHGEMAVMDMSGDTKVIWSRDNADEVEMARKQFAEFKKKGFAAFSVKGKNGDKDVQIHEFDPSAERIIFIPPMVGG
jgi:hypothetical protein